MFYSDIIRRVRDLAGDSGALQFTDTVLTDWINDGVRECVIQNNLMQKSGTIASLTSTEQYPCPTDILKLHSIKYDTAKLRSMTLNEYDALGSQGPLPKGTPVAYYIFAGIIHFNVIPDTAGKVIAIDYIADPVNWDGGNPTTTAPVIPTSYHARIVTYCMAQVAMQDDDPNKYQMLMDMFATGVGVLKDNLDTEEDLYPSITVSGRDGYSYGLGYPQW